MNTLKHSYLLILLLLAFGQNAFGQCAGDVTLPVANCHSSTDVYLNASGFATIMPNQLDNGSTDNCGIAMMQINNQTLWTVNCADIGSQSVQFTVIDTAGNSATCPSMIQVIDTISPTANCISTVTIDLSPSGTSTLNTSNIDNGSFDNCASGVSILINGGNSITYTCNDVGTNIATLTVLDASGNSDTCQVLVLVNDVTAPVINCQNITIPIGTTITANDILIAPTFDACGIATQTINGGNSVTYTCDSVGSRSITVEITDNNGLSSTCSPLITIVDTTAPTANCQTGPIVVQLDPNGYGSISGNMLNAGSSDNCGIVHTMINNNTSDYEIYFCNNIGNNVANYIVMDAAGNIDTCQTNVLVQDNIYPTAFCQNLTVYIGGNATDSVAPADVNNNSYDNCGPISLTLNSLSSSFVYDTSDAGSHTVTLIVTDASGNADSCSAIITVVDTTNQNNCQVAATVINNVSCNGMMDGDAVATTTGAVSPTTYLWSNGHTHALVQNLPAGTYTVSITDANNCTDQATVVITEPAPLQLTITTTPSYCSSSDGTMTAIPTGGNAGGYFYQWHNGQTDQTLTNLAPNYWNRVTVTDWYGCSATHYASIPVLDTTAPVINCVDTTLYLDQSGYAYMVSFDLAYQYGSDDCGIAWSYLGSMGSPTTLYDCSQLGGITETIYVYDGANNTDSCSFNLTILDTITPNMACQNHTVYVGTNTTATVFPSDIDGGSTDNCGIQSLSINGLASMTYNINHVGSNSAILTGQDFSGFSSCNATVTVVDTSNSSSNCQIIAATISDVSCYGAADGVAISTANGTFPISYLWDNGQTTSTVNSLTAGTHTVTMTDALGCTHQTTVLITEPAPLSAIITTVGTTCGTSNGSLSAIGNGGTPNYTYNWNNGNTTASLTGLYANYWARVTLTDANGCTATHYATVPTIDTVAPIISCVDTTLYLGAGGNAYMLSFDLAQQYGWDNCGITWSTFTTMGGPTAVYNCSQIGTFAETIIVYDGNNNADSCTFNLTILDTVAPVANCAIYTAYVSGANTALVYPNNIDDGSTDNCSIGSMLINGSSILTYTTSNIGYNPVTLTVYDGSGNISTCNTWVYVVDTSQTPVANCVGSYTAYLDNSGSALVDNNDINNGSTGNNIYYYVYGPLGIGTSFLPVNCNNIGSYNYNFIVTDNMNQQDTCSFVLNVVDSLAPNANCQTTYTLPLSGTSATLYPSDLDNGSSDNCGISNMTINGQDSLVFGCNEVGTAQWVVLTVEDASGNISSCQTLVYIMGGSCGVQVSLVSSNPSNCDTSLCTGVATVTATGGQNPYTFLWNDGNTNANRTGLCPAVYTVIVTDVNSGTDTLLVTIGYGQGCVWPGDTDDDAQVNNMDLLPIALAYGAPGFTRSNASLVWKGQSAQDWNIANPVQNLPDYKHIDCDGSALIDLTDVNAITQNYGLSYLRSNSSTSGTIPFYVESDTAYEKDRVGLSIYLGAPGNLAADVYGVAFTINYDPTVVEAGSTSVDYNNSWLGANLISVQKDFHSQGKIETAVGRINHINTSGFGQIGTFYITIRDDVLRAPVARDMPISITNVRLIDKDNNVIGTNNQTGILTVLEIITSTTDIQSKTNDLQVFPNPSDGNLTIKSENSSLEQLKVLTITGQTIMDRPLNGQTQEQINLNNLPNGSYILSITTDKEVFNKQIIIRH